MIRETQAPALCYKTGMSDAPEPTDAWPIFICYRQADGQPTAARIYELLDKEPVPMADADKTQPELDVYYDQAAPGVSDWTAVHEPFLKRARAMILICTPGAKLHEGPGDIVHQELDWWLAHREMAPILVDPLGQQLRYVPDAIAKRWPNAQRIKMQESDWDDLPDDSRVALRQRLQDQFIGAIVPSSDAFYRQELDETRARAHHLRQTQRRMGLLTILLLAVIGASAWIYTLKTAADQARLAAQNAQAGELAARELAEARLIENQAMRAATEARLFGYLQQFPRFDAYTDQLQGWAGDLKTHSDRLNAASIPLLPACHETAEFTVYEGQLVQITPDAVQDDKVLWAYLAVVPGQSPRPGDWAPAVLDVILAAPDQITSARRKDRNWLQDQIARADIAKDHRWSFVVGLAGGNYLQTTSGTYRLTQTAIRMNDDGDMIMRFALCQEDAVLPP